MNLSLARNAENRSQTAIHYFREWLILGFAFLVAAFGCSAQAQIPAQGETAPDFTLQTKTAQSVRLSAQSEKGTTVLVFLRGYPGYQCPFF